MMHPDSFLVVKIIAIAGCWFFAARFVGLVVLFGRDMLPAW
jgi:hypothetical protein